jgi:hypothetical protein
LDFPIGASPRHPQAAPAGPWAQANDSQACVVRELTNQTVLESFRSS